MVRPSDFTKVHPTYYRGVRSVMESVSAGLDATPDATEVFFGTTGSPNAQDQMPNYQVTCRGRSFVFRGANHHPFDGSGVNLSALESDQFREGSFAQENLTQGWAYTDICRYANKDTPEDDDGSFEDNLKDYYEPIVLPMLAETSDPGNTKRRYRNQRVAERDAAFRDRLFQKQGKPYHCAVCDIEIDDCLQGAHVIDVQYDGRDLVSNGIILCASHHLLFDKHQFGIDPSDRSIVVSSKSRWSRKEMRITRDKISEAVCDAALEARWKRFQA